MRFKPFRPEHALERTIGAQDQFSLGQVEIERAALFAFDLERVIGRIERLQH